MSTVVIRESSMGQIVGGSLSPAAYYHLRGRLNQGRCCHPRTEWSQGRCCRLRMGWSQKMGQAAVSNLAGMGPNSLPHIPQGLKMAPQKKENLEVLLDYRQNNPAGDIGECLRC